MIHCNAKKVDAIVAGSKRDSALLVKKWIRKDLGPFQGVSNLQRSLHLFRRNIELNDQYNRILLLKVTYFLVMAFCYKSLFIINHYKVAPSTKCFSFHTISWMYQEYSLHLVYEPSQRNFDLVQKLP